MLLAASLLYSDDTFLEKAEKCYVAEITFALRVENEMKFTFEGTREELVKVLNVAPSSISPSAKEASPSPSVKEAITVSRDSETDEYGDIIVYTLEKGDEAVAFTMRHVPDEDTLLAETTVTQELWAFVMGSNPSVYVDPQNPVDSVSWYDCKEYCERLSEITGDNFDLPDEALWEKAARAGTTTDYYTGDTITLADANFYDEGSPGKPVPVKSYPPNPWGFYEVLGNVWEWMKNE